MILFLDFDGVLHPEQDREPTPFDELFCFLPQFESVMRDFPQIEIVISSMWRYDFSLDELRTKFSPDIAVRIISTTALTERIDGKYLPARREGEMLDWLAANNRVDEPWLAIDDAAWQFQNHRSRLIECTWYKGLDTEALTRLQTILAKELA